MSNNSTGVTFIGVDPGTSGGIAALDERGRIVHLSKMPDNDDDEGLVRIFEELSHPAGRIGRADIFAILEHVWSAPGWGHVGAFKFGGSFRGCKVAMTACRIPFTLVVPRKWQASFGIVYPKGEKKRDKNITKDKAQQLYPKVSVTHATADALLLAEYCRRLHRDSTLKRSAK